ncbi:MAG: translocation/assembly module TamB [Paludibacteraceae bacterium]|nr:translocation/assembly module TamB [Paludibacteraceae bacterium]
MQTFLAKYAASYLSESLGTTLSIGKVKISHLTDLELEEVSLADQQGEEMLGFGNLKLKMKLLPLINKKIVIKNIYIDGLSANIYVTQDSVTNLQFIIDAFPTDTTSQMPDISIKSIELKEAKIHYRDWRDSTDIDIRHINTNAKFEIDSQSEIKAEINGMDFCKKEKKVLDNLKLKLLANDHILGVRNLEVDLRNSKIKLDAAKIDYAYKNDKSIDWGNSSYLINLSPSTFVPQDISWLVPQLNKMDKPIHFELDAKGTFDQIETQKIRLDYDESIFLVASINVQNATKLDSLQAELDITDLRFSSKAISTLVRDITAKDITLPKELDQLGVCDYNGTISGNPQDVKLIGNLSTAQGKVHTDLEISSKDSLKNLDFIGYIGTTTIDVGKIINKPELGLGQTEVKINTKAHFNENGKYDIIMSGNIDKATFKNYTYKNISLDGRLTNEMFAGKVLMDDPNGKLRFDGTLVLNDINKRFSLTSTIENVRPWELHLLQDNKNTSFSLGIDMDVTLTNINDVNGKVNISGLDIVNDEKTFHLDSIEFEAVNNNDTNHLDIKSDLINGNIYGHYKVDEIHKNLISTLGKNLPRLQDLNIGKAAGETDITISFEIEPLERLMKSIEIPWYTTEASTGHFSYKSKSNRISSYFIVPNITNGSSTFDNTLLNINNYQGVNLKLKTETDIKLGHVEGTFNVKMDNGTITSSLVWENVKSNEVEFGGELMTKTTFEEQNDKWTTNLEVLPTQFMLHGTPWLFGHSNIQFKDESINIDNFSITSEGGQQIAVNGKISDQATDTLDVKIEDLTLEYISEMLPREVALSFGGRLSAESHLSNIKSDDPHINLDASSTPFIFNGAEVGIMKAKCSFDTQNNNLDFYGQVFSSADTSAVLDGHYFFNKDSLDIQGKANGLELGFINHYIKDIFGTVSGQGYGDVHIYGKDGNVAVDADVLAKDASLKVNFLNTSFFFTDSIKLTKDIIDFGEIALTDENGRKGRLEGNIKHNYFKDMELDLAIHCDTMQVMNTTRAENPTFFGKILATGDIMIYGPTNDIAIAGKARTEPQTKINFPIDNYTATENSFITFVETKKQEKATIDESPKSNLRVNLLIDICPQTEATVITNSKSGDKLDARLSGNLQMAYDISKSDLKLYGDLNVISGLYVFTLQEVIRKEFNFKEGGNITWSGDPLNAKLDIEGYYQLNANIADLLSEADLVNVARTTVPVQCQLHISGNLIQPTINFNIDLPSSDDEIKMAVQKAIDSPEKLYREVIALLLLGKFIKAESMDNSSFISQNEIYSAVSSTISAQINNWASQMFDKWDFGVNFRKTDNGTTSNKDEYEYEFNFQYSPTDRILINGNVGYRNNSSNNNFIGDFDFEYKLVESGQLRIKAYTHTNDYKEFKKGLRTQGVGLLWTENFNNGKELSQTIKRQIEQGKVERKERREARKKKREERAGKKAQAKTQSNE